MRLFDLAEADRLVPLLTRTFAAIRSWLEEIQALTVKLESFGADPKAQERVMGDRDERVVRIRQEVSRMEEMGLEVKGLDGLVDFRATMNGRTVYLCWKMGETHVSHWHELDSGFSGRRPLEQAGPISPSYLS